jgi:hypothetical protein
MFPYVFGAIIGAIVMGRTKPKTAMKTLQLLGPRTGIQYTAELMPGENVVVLHAPDNTISLFQKGEDGRFRLLRALKGFPQTVKYMQMDLEP